MGSGWSGCRFGLYVRDGSSTGRCGVVGEVYTDGIICPGKMVEDWFLWALSCEPLTRGMLSVMSPMDLLQSLYRCSIYINCHMQPLSVRIAPASCN